MASDADNRQQSAQLQPFRIFLASPGDVHDERRRAKKVIDQISYEVSFRDCVDTKVVAWDQPGEAVAMDAGLTPQEAIAQGLPKPSECDLVVVILWARMGTPLPSDYEKADGSPYLSGTEWEYENAMAAESRPERPAVWVYRRKETPAPKLDDPNYLKIVGQWQKVTAFFERLTNSDGSFEGGVNSYQNPEAFEKKFRGHLRDHLSKRFLSTAAEVPVHQDDAGDDTRKAIEDYGRKAESYHAHLPVAGFATRLKVPIDIEDIYVPLRAMLDLRGVDDGRFADAAHAEKMLHDRDAGLEIPLADAFHQCDQRRFQGVVILGDPGSGKTTHLKRLLLWCLRKGPESLGLPPGMLPVFLALRNLENTQSGLDDFIQAELTQPHLDTPKNFGKRLLKRGNLLLLLDGLDEVADITKREEVARWIVGAVKAHPDCRLVITCRFAGYSPTVKLSADFLEMHLRPLTEAQVAEFVRNWYRIVEQGLAKDPDQAEGIAAEKAELLIARLKEPDFRARRVFELTRNPLLLTNICLIHRHRGELPKKRARLYEECIDVLLEHWRGAVGLSAGVTVQEGRRVLQPAALWLHQKEGRTRATAGELAPHIAPVLKAVKWTGGSVDDFLAKIRDQSGLITGWDQERYGFMHLGFQEYLAAREIRTRAFKDHAALRELAGHFGESWWQEVCLLLLALDDPSLFEPFMREVAATPAFVRHADLVEMCLDDAAETSASPFLELVKTPPGKRKALWERQLAALKFLERLAPEEIEPIEDLLAQHPYEAIRNRMAASRRQDAQETIINAADGYELVLIPGGSFTMGSPEDEDGRYRIESPQHLVQVPAFFMGRYPVTNAQYQKFLQANPNLTEPEYWSDRKYNQSQQPVVGVSWKDALAYARWAGLRLPSEAEWEYACRAGTTTRYYTGDGEKDLDQAGWYSANSGRSLRSVGEKVPNDFGLYDMHGNVWEWVEDGWHGDYEGAPTDGRAWLDNASGTGRVVRGGSWDFGAGYCRSASRGGYRPGGRNDGLGFRLSRYVTLGS